MYTATHANVRTAVAANKSGPAKALDVAFSGGSIMGLLLHLWVCSVLEYYTTTWVVVLKLFTQ